MNSPEIDLEPHPFDIRHAIQNIILKETPLAA